MAIALQDFVGSHSRILRPFGKSIKSHHCSKLAFQSQIALFSTITSIIPSFWFSGKGITGKQTGKSPYLFAYSS
jgi:hypothetical protein